MARADPVLFVTQYYAPEEIGSAPYCVDLARWLVEAGFAVEVVTGQPHYPSAELYRAFHEAQVRRENDGESKGMSWKVRAGSSSTVTAIE